MKKIYLFEEFTNKTLSKNNSEYDIYFNTHKGESRSDMVAWESKGSQERNFNMTAKHIDNGDSILDYGCGIGDFIEYLIEHNIGISDYMGVDINENFIKISKETYPNHNFEKINDINQINGQFDVVCAIGVFTWYITKEEFIETIHKLHSLCKKRLILTVLDGFTPYDEEYAGVEEDYWSSEYRHYSENLFNELFPDLDISYEYNKTTILINIKK